MMITNDWLKPLEAEFSKPYYEQLYHTVDQEYKTQTIYPAAEDIFNAFSFTPLEKVKVVLTVRAHQANSHHGIGWEAFTDAAIRVLDQIDRPMVFILWGRPAQMKEAMLRNPKHLILKSPHPSPLSAYRGFFGSRPFSKTNQYLEAHGLTPIDWQIENRQA